MANHFSYSFFHPHFLSVFSTAPVWYHRGAWPGCSFNSWREPLYLLTFILNFLMCCGLNFETVWKIYLDKSFWDPKGLVIPFKKSFDSMAKLIWVCLTSSQCVMKRRTRDLPYNCVNTRTWIINIDILVQRHIVYAIIRYIQIDRVVKILSVHTLIVRYWLDVKKPIWIGLFFRYFSGTDKIFTSAESHVIKCSYLFRQAIFCIPSSKVICTVLSYNARRRWCSRDSTMF